MEPTNIDNNKNNSEAPISNDGPWEEFAAESAGQEPDLRRSMVLRQELADFEHQYSAINDKYNGAIPDYINEPLRKKHDSLASAIKEAQIAEIKTVIPESQVESFDEYVGDDSSKFTIDAVSDGIYRYSQGEDLEDIKKYILAQDWNGTDEEDERARGMSVYNKIVAFLGIDD